MFTNRESQCDRVASRSINESRVACRTRSHRCAHCMQPRRGMSLMIVMVAISTSLVLTYSFLRTQTIALKISQNGKRRDLALQAAQTGAAVAVERIQSADWKGVAEQLTRNVSSDAAGTSSYTVEFLQRESDSEGPDDSALSLRIHSTGIWQSATNAEETVKRIVEVVAELKPRVPGRDILTEDSESAMDIAANPGDYDRTQDHAVFASTGHSLSVHPASRIDGKLWIGDHIHLYDGHHWKPHVRDELLRSIGDRFVTGGVNAHPHPFGNGDVPAEDSHMTFALEPKSSMRGKLGDLKVSWQQTDETLSLPAIDFDHWRTYRLYDGGFEYQAQLLGSQLDGTTLAPSPGNPLGIFFREGSIELDDHVTIRGTLVATGTITISGDSVRLTAFNWRGDGGRPVTTNGSSWPRLPSLVAHNVEIRRDCQTTIEGAVIVNDRLRGAGGDFEYTSVPDVDFTITATARPLEQPISLLTVESGGDLGLLNQAGDYSVWLPDGKSGSWHAIVGVDRLQRELAVIGELNISSATSLRVRRTRRRYADIRGPVACRKVDIKRSPAWTTPTESQWDDLHERWEDLNDEREDDDLEPIAFVDWLADPANFVGWPHPISEYGLRLEPTFHLRGMTGIDYRWEPPLFQAYQGTGTEAEFSGYRWQVLSWREAP